MYMSPSIYMLHVHVTCIWNTFHVHITYICALPTYESYPTYILHTHVPLCHMKHIPCIYHMYLRNMYIYMRSPNIRIISNVHFTHVLGERIYVSNHIPTYICDRHIYALYMSAYIWKDIYALSQHMMCPYGIRAHTCVKVLGERIYMSKHTNHIQCTFHTCMCPYATWNTFHVYITCICALPTATCVCSSATCPLTHML